MGRVVPSLVSSYPELHVSSNVHIQVHHTVCHVYVFPYGISQHNFFKDQSIFPFVILNSHSLSLENSIDVGHSFLLEWFGRSL